MITGPMFSGKSEELIRRVKRSIIAGQKVQVFKPAVDTRDGVEYVSSHDERKIEAIPAASSQEVLEKLNQQTEVVGLDEIQFFDEGIIDVINELVLARYVKVIASCLNLDFRTEPFPFKDSKRTVAEVILKADSMVKLSSICTHKISNNVICGREAIFSQRMIDGKPAPYDSPTFLVGAKEFYEPRCREHHVIKRK